MLSDDSRPSHRCRRSWRWSAALGAVVLISGYVGCGFPDYTYDDNAFYDSGVSGGSGGVDASAGNGGLGGSGGTGAIGGSGGTGAIGGSGGSTGGTGGTGGSTGGTGGSGGTGGGTGGEDCTNGKDDDGDGKIDCQDTDCQGPYTCAPGVLTGGWLGPVAMWDGTPGSEPNCFASGSYVTPATSGNANVQGGTWSCQGCSCGNPTGGSCSDVDIQYWDTTSCSGGCWGCTGTPFALTNGGACTVFGEIHGPGGESPKAATFSPPTASGGSCAANADQSKKNIPKPTWQKSMVACTGAPTSGKGCGATSACIPVPKSPFGFTCMYKVGDNPCPSGPYTHKHVYYTGYQDGRTCSACSCGSPTGQNCSGTVKTYTDSCSSDETVMSVPNQCYPIPPDSSTAPYDGGLEDTRGSVFTAGAPAGGSCSPGGGQKSGSVASTGAVTFCCL